MEQLASFQTPLGLKVMSLVPLHFQVNRTFDKSTDSLAYVQTDGTGGLCLCTLSDILKNLSVLSVSEY